MIRDTVNAWDAVELVFPTLHRWAHTGFPPENRTLVEDIAILTGCRDAVDRVLRDVAVPECRKRHLDVCIIGREGTNAGSSDA